MESILTSIKKLLGINSDYTHFDPDIVMHINTVLMDLTMLGVGPRTGFSIEDDTAVWSDFLSNPTDLAGIKSYIYLRVKLLFDASTLSAAHIESINEQIKKFEWTLNVAAEDKGTGSDSSGGSGSIDSSVVEELNALVAALQESNNTLKSSNATLSAENTILKLSNESLESSNAELQVSNISLSTRNTELEKRNSDLLASNETLQNENSDLEIQNGELIASNETLQNENTELEESNATLSARVEELEAAGSAEELETLIDESEVLEGSYETATEKVEALIDKAEFSNAFWDGYQKNGERTDYNSAFAYDHFTNDTFYPKYDIICSKGTSGIFRQTIKLTIDLIERLKSCGVVLDTSACTYGNYIFEQSAVSTIPTLSFPIAKGLVYAFNGCKNLITIEKLIVNKDISLDSCFSNCTELQNIILEGEIGQNFKMQQSTKLTLASAKSILLCLFNYSETDLAYAYTVTLPTETWALLNADGKTSPDGTSWEEYVDSKGWNK